MDGLGVNWALDSGTQAPLWLWRTLCDSAGRLQMSCTMHRNSRPVLVVWLKLCPPSSHSVMLSHH